MDIKYIKVMSFTAVAHPLSYRLHKRDTLLFDSIGFVLLERNLRDLPPELARETEWLLAKGVVEDIELTIERDELPEADSHKLHLDCAAAYLVSEALRLMADGSYTAVQGLSDKLYYEAADMFAPVWNLDPREVAPVATAHAATVLTSQRSLSREQLLDEADIALQAGYDASARVTALCLTKRQMSDAVPILVVSPIGELTATTPLQPVASIVLEDLPSPDAKTPWESIIDFRHDEKAVQSLRRLRRWLRTVASPDRSLREIREEIESMVHEYSSYLALHKIETSRSRLEILLSLASETVDSLGQLKPATVHAPFDVRTHRMSLYEIEKAAAGREVAYLTDTRRRLTATTA
jgi:hypothetical protein